MPSSSESTKATLPKEIFDVEVQNHDLLKLAYNSYLANSRNAHATTKARGEVSGGGKKPWKQKGTGRARVGSTRSPIWRHGGIVFGPNGTENYKLNVPKNAKRLAVKQALSLANKSGKITICEVTTNGKTKDIVTLLKKLELSNEAKVLLVVDIKTDELIRATNNLANITLKRAIYSNVFDILNADSIVITKDAIKALEAWLGENK